MSGDELFKKLAKGKARERRSVTIYLSRPLFDSFKTLCSEKEVSASQAIEQMVRDLMDSTKSRAPSAPSIAGVSGSTPDRMAAALEVLRNRDDLIDVIIDLAKLRTPAHDKPKSASKRRVG